MKSLMWLVAFGVGVYFVGLAVLGRGEDREVWAARMSSPSPTVPEWSRRHWGPIKVVVVEPDDWYLEPGELP